MVQNDLNNLTFEYILLKVTHVCMKRNGNNNPSTKVSCNKLQYKKQQTKNTYHTC